MYRRALALVAVVAAAAAGDAPAGPYDNPICGSAASPSVRASSKPSRLHRPEWQTRALRPSTITPVYIRTASTAPTARKHCESCHAASSQTAINRRRNRR